MPDLANNTLQTATELQVDFPKILQGALSTATDGDLVDYYKFTTSAPSSLKLDLRDLSGNARLRFFSQSPNLTITELTTPAQANGGRLSEGLVQNNLAAGTYYIQVLLESGATAADYNLSVTSAGELQTDNVAVWRSADGSSVPLWQMQGTTPYYGAVGNVILPPNYQLVGRGDLDGDGRKDLVWSDLAGNTAAWLMDGTTIKSAAFLAPVPAGWQIAAIGDFDGDARADLFWRNGNQVAIWLMNGVTYKEASFLDNIPAQYFVAGVGDFDGDGKKDLLWRSPAAEVAIWLMNGATYKDARFLNQIPNEYQVVGIANFNATVPDNPTSADNTDDILWRDSSGNTAMWLMNGTQFKQADFLLPIPPSWQIVGVGDFDADGNADLFWRQAVEAKVAVWLMNGLTYKEASFLPDIPSEYSVAGVADFNRDKKADLLWRSPNSGGNAAVWLMNGATYSEAQLIPLSGLGAYAFNGFLGSSEFVVSTAALSLAGPSPGFAFDLGFVSTPGVVNATGNYQDSVAGAVKDFYKFRVAEQPAFFTMSALTPGSLTPLSSVNLVLLKETTQNNQTTTTPVTYRPGGTLEPGIYYIEVGAVNSSSTTPIAYNLQVVGTPAIIDLVGTALSVTPSAVRLPDTSAEQATVDLGFTIRNQETAPSGAVKVRFYLSRDEEINPTIDQVLKLTNGQNAEKTLTSIAALSNGSDVLSGVVLPPGDDNFWTTDRTYYIGMVIDPDNTINESNENNNFNVALNQDKQGVAISNTRIADLVAASITLPSTSISAGATLGVTYTIRNDGRKSTGSINDNIPLQFYLSKTPQLNTSDPLSSILLGGSAPRIQALDVPAQGSVTETKSLQVPTLQDDLGGTRPFWEGVAPATPLYLVMVVDEAPGVGVIPEASEENNVTNIPVTFAG